MTPKGVKLTLTPKGVKLEQCTASVWIFTGALTRCEIHQGHDLYHQAKIEVPTYRLPNVPDNREVTVDIHWRTE